MNIKALFTSFRTNISMLWGGLFGAIFASALLEMFDAEPFGEASGASRYYLVFLIVISQFIGKSIIDYRTGQVPVEDIHEF